MKLSIDDEIFGEVGDVTVGQQTNRALLIRVKNTAELARSQGALASFVQSLAPATVEAKVYDTLKSKLAAALRDQNVDAELVIVEPSAFKDAGAGHVARDVGLAVAAAGGLALLWHLFKSRKK